MVKEMRKIVLSREELIAALESYKRNNPDFLPPGKITDCTLSSDAPVSINVENASGSKTQPLTLSLDAAKLLEPMIHFCIEHNVILPRHSRKSALTGEDQAVLYIQMPAN